jgi:hypothetical protein
MVDCLHQYLTKPFINQTRQKLIYIFYAKLLSHGTTLFQDYSVQCLDYTGVW